MPTHAEHKLVPYTTEQMFDLVADVGRYSEFLPWCAASRVRSHSTTEMVADLTIGFGPFRESFTSRVALERPERCRVKYENGPFRYLNNQWTFTPRPAGCGWISSSTSSSAAGCCKRRSAWCSTRRCCAWVNAFQKRAQDVYGLPRATVAVSTPRAGQGLMVAAPAPASSTVPVRINLYSDTQTKPSAAMKAAMMEAEVGDEQSGTDPTSTRCASAWRRCWASRPPCSCPPAPCATRVAILTHCRPGDEILAHETAHIISSEGGAPGALAGAQVTGLRGEGGPVRRGRGRGGRCGRIRATACRRRCWR